LKVLSIVKEDCDIPNTLLSFFGSPAVSVLDRVSYPSLLRQAICIAV
jgi:hypothetical protein